MHFTKNPIKGKPSISLRMLIASACGLAGLSAAPLARADLGGFAGFTLNGGATSDGTTLTLTDGGSSEARSAFNAAVQNITSFTTSFTYTDVGGGGADGFTFAIHNDPRGAAALGDPGGSLGYGGTNKITPSAADAFNLFGTAGTGYRTNGNKETGATGPVNVSSGNPINVTLRYSGPTLTETLTDTVTGATSFKAYAANIPAAVGASTAYVGFTAGTGSVTSTQRIGNFTLTNVPVVTRSSTPLAVTGFNQDIVVEAGATNDPTNHYLGAVTATLDGNTGNPKNGATFYETGLPGTTRGLPVGGTNFISQDDPNTTFKLQSGTGNNSLQLNSTNPTGTLTLSSPQKLSQLVVLATTGSGSYLSAPMTLHFSDRPDLVLAYSAPDWFGRDGAGLLGVDRINASNGNPDNNTGDPRLYETSLDLSQFGVQNNQLTSISFDFGGGTTGGGNTEIMAVSASPTPEPTTLGLFALGGMGLLIRRRIR